MFNRSAFEFLHFRFYRRVALDGSLPTRGFERYAQRMTSNVTEINRRSGMSATVGAEFRAEMARKGLSQAKVSAQLHVSQAWLSRRIGLKADVDLTLEDIAVIAEALDVSAQRLVSLAFTSVGGDLLPRLDSNQQPSDYQYAQVIDLTGYRIERREVAS